MPRTCAVHPKGVQMFRVVAVLMLALSVSPMSAVAADETDQVSRPVVLPALYASYAALQVYDAYSTKQALAHAAHETNPLMQQVVGKQSAFWAVKASATATTILAAEHLWRKNNKKGAIAVLVASNAVAAVVAARNASVLRSQR